MKLQNHVFQIVQTSASESALTALMREFGFDIQWELHQCQPAAGSKETHSNKVLKALTSKVEYFLQQIQNLQAQLNARERPPASSGKEWELMKTSAPNLVPKGKAQVYVGRTAISGLNPSAWIQNWAHNTWSRGNSATVGSRLMIHTRAHNDAAPPIIGNNGGSQNWSSGCGPETNPGNDKKKITGIPNQNNEQQQEEQEAIENERQEEELAISRLNTLKGLVRNRSERERLGEHGIHFIACRGENGIRPFQIMSNVEMNECHSFNHVAESVIIFNFTGKRYDFDYWLHHLCTTTGSQNSEEPPVVGRVVRLHATQTKRIINKKIGSFRLRHVGTPRSNLCMSRQQYYEDLNKN